MIIKTVRNTRSSFCDICNIIATFAIENLFVLGYNKIT